MGESDKDNQTLTTVLKDSVNVMNCPYFHVCMKLCFIWTVSIYFGANHKNPLFWGKPSIETEWNALKLIGDLPGKKL